MMALMERARTEIEKGDGPWSTVHGRRQGLSKWRIYLLNHPGVPMIGVLFLTALGITVLIEAR
jgi:hypothetical protein